MADTHVRPLTATFGPITVILIVFMVVDWSLMAACKLPAERAPEQPALLRVWGGLGRTSEAKGAATVTTPEQALAFEKENGRESYIMPQSERARVLFKPCIQNLNRRGSTATALSCIGTPPALWLSANDNKFEEPIRRIRTYPVYSLLDKTQLQTIRKSLLLEVEVPR